MKKILSLIVLGIFLINLASAIIICVDKTSPSAPSNLTVSGEVGSIFLTWVEATDEPSCSGIDYYNVSRNNVSLGVTTSLNFTDSESLIEGSYTYTVFAVDKVGHNRGDFIVNEVVLSKDEGTDIISVDGGGSGSSYVTPDSFETYSVPDGELGEGFLETMGKDDKMVFEFDDESHSLVVLNVDYNKVEIVISSTPQKAIFSEGESKSFDLNDDDMDDLVVNVENINNGFAEIKIQSLDRDSDDEIIVDDAINSDENFDDEDEGFFSTVTGAVVGTVRSTGGVIIGVFVVLAVGGFVAVRIRRR